MTSPFDQPLEPLETYLRQVRTICEHRGDSVEIIEERIRFAEVLWYHAQANWVNPSCMIRLLNLICNPETWEEWKEAGGDFGETDEDPLDPELN